MKAHRARLYGASRIAGGPSHVSENIAVRSVVSKADATSPARRAPSSTARLRKESHANHRFAGVAPFLAVAENVRPAARRAEIVRPPVIIATA
jgi:hypothetical protein